MIKQDLHKLLYPNEMESSSDHTLDDDIKAMKELFIGYTNDQESFNKIKELFNQCHSKSYMGDRLDALMIQWAEEALRLPSPNETAPASTLTAMNLYMHNIDNPGGCRWFEQPPPKPKKDKKTSSSGCRIL